MNKDLLEPVIKLTSQQDSHALAHELLKILLDFLSLQQAVIYKLCDQSSDIVMEQVLKLVQKKDWAGNHHHELIEDVIGVAPDTDAMQCIDQGNIVINDTSPGLCKLIVPIVIKHKISAILELKGQQSIIESIDFIGQFIKIYENYLTLLNKSERDKLTGLFNRRTFDGKLNHMLAMQKNKKRQAQLDKSGDEKRQINSDASAWLVILDIDFFKRVNDEYGHVAGDEVLLRLSQKMKQDFRYTDLLFRFGGEEFVIILEPIPSAMAQATLERFRKNIAEYQFPLVGATTVSIGYAKITENDFPATILGYADKALYFGKEHGRNCVYNYEALIESGELGESSTEGTVDLF